MRRFIACDVNLTVLYKATAPEFEQGFDELKAAYPDVHFMEESDYGSQVLGWINNVTSELLFFGCDDVLFYRPVDISQIIQCFQTELGLLGFSLRLGTNIHFNHTRRDQVPQPEFLQQRPVLIWNWKNEPADWGYPFELNGTIYRTELVQLLVQAMETMRMQTKQLEWRHPNLTETAGNQLLNALPSVPQKMASFPESCLIVPTVNQVQHLAQNHIMGEVRSVGELEQWRREGRVLDLDAYANATFDRIHVGEFFTISKKYS